MNLWHRFLRKKNFQFNGVKHIVSWFEFPTFTKIGIWFLILKRIFFELRFFLSIEFLKKRRSNVNQQFKNHQIIARMLKRISRCDMSSNMLSSNFLVIRCVKLLWCFKRITSTFLNMRKIYYIRFTRLIHRFSRNDYRTLYWWINLLTFTMTKIRISKSIVFWNCSTTF